MTPDQLRALADALQQDIDELRLLAPGELTAADEAWFAMHDKAIACLLACADAQPVGMLTVATFRGHLENRDFDYTGDLPDGNYPLYTHPAPAAPQAEPKREPLSDAQLASVCLSYRHDFGLLDKDEQARLMLEARDWERAFRKEWQREPLSDDDIIKLAWKQNLWTDHMIEFSFLAFAREVERAHGIGGSDE